MLTLGLMAPTVLHAQDETAPVVLADGVYEGSVNFTGGFILDLADFVDETGLGDGSVNFGGQATLDAAISGPASMTVAGGDVTGEWTLAGPSTMDGLFTGSAGGRTVVLLLEAVSVHDGAGTFSGLADAASMLGTMNSTVNATVNFDGREQSATSNNSDELALTLTEPLGDCGRAFARVDLELRQDIEALPGATATIIGVFTGAPADGAYDFIELEVLNGRIAALWNRLATAEDALDLIAEAFELLRDIEAAEDQLEGLDCGQDADFANAMTLLAADLVRVALDLAATGNFPPGEQLVIIERALELGLRTGALGAGSVDRGGASQTAERARAAIQRVFSEASVNGDSKVVLEAALLARQYGWMLVAETGLTSDDALFGLGEG